MKSLDELLETARVIICAGTGGVGKTTVAASLGLRAAARGRRAVVLTIDPARRLANALGLEGLGDEVTEVRAEGIPSGHLAAMMLDQKGAWDRLVEQHAPSEEIRQRILANHFYQNLSQNFAGSQEFMAVEQLCTLHEGGQFDLLVVDTPPSRHALDFLDAPQRLADFLDRNVVKWFIRPYFSATGLTLNLMNRAVGGLLRRLEDATGISALLQVSEFFTSLAGLFENFEPRVRRVGELLRSKDTAFVLVASPEEQVLAEAREFLDRVEEMEVQLAGVVFNRVHLPFRDGRRGERFRRLAEELGRETGIPGLVDLMDRHETLGQGDARRMERFRESIEPEVCVRVVPNLPADVHTLEALRGLHAHLFP